ncbi:ferric-dicitrate binding protein FerR (iron transport regulator) [Chitinophaga terrae (ex Kim and Jung 2007)]|uniref:FecR family protein n=1 Tax=Chitinophaga terrae (ex Kim and Jung 2007) TaxID=408074 RepID=UPI002787C68E|nr:FecR domain-containing protein [Chitinophaga terrae (ex Kim and Jung 2007)]MDQ0106440.1 ferric-dicitrate binding protein FerR (iron transport regulator) [Chitinophaga terrae (ex Kim and Jung 2007)]
MEQFDTYYYDLMAKKLSGHCTTAEITELEQWLAASPEHQAEYDILSKIWQDSIPADSARTYNPDSAWQKIELATAPATPVKPIINWKKFSAAAAVIVAVASASWFFTHTPLKKHELAANEGKIKSIQLPDRSMVTLRQGARIKYINGYHHDKRVVELEGEAFFEIANDPEHPFLVKTANDSYVEVLGTSFTVQSTKDSTAVIVATGQVRLGAENDGADVVLNAGQRGVWGNGQLSSRNNNNPNFIAWKTGVLAFNDQSLLEILPQLADFYAKEIRIDSNYQTTAAKQKATITFSNQSCDDALHELQLLLGFNFRHEGDAIVISQ